ncbi:D-arabinono-1,4-lactone oxidase [Cytophagaceae bacterium ABcell3]|nr:D-arabinono-1,4-lactone oxidase [Cytophagaceae bacterium ABcell3]
MAGIRKRINKIIPWVKKKEKTFVNWSGSVKFTPETIAEPRSTEEVSDLVRRALYKDKTIRVAGAGHSSSPLLQTSDTLLSFNQMKGVHSYDIEKQQATIYPGMTVGEIGQELLKLGFSLHNTGDVDMQNLSGAIGTGTHGTGIGLPNLSAMLHGVEMVNGKGDVLSFDYDKDPEMMDALRVSMGALGVFTKMILNTTPALQLDRKEYCTHVDVAMQHLNDLVQNNRNFDFYWYPRNDLVKLRTHNLQGQKEQLLPYAKLAKEKTGWLNEILPKFRHLKYEEMEYALPAEAGPDCFAEVRKRVKQKHRDYVGWRVLYRTVQGDNSWLSPFYQRDSVTIAILQNLGLPYWPYFKDIEPIFRAYGGRPHWGKKHTLTADTLRDLYPRWDDFMKVRRMMDPKGIFLNSYLKKLLHV